MAPVSAEAARYLVQGGSNSIASSSGAIIYAAPCDGCRSARGRMAEADGDDDDDYDCAPAA
ncbi:unnamed protein product [Urochloa decumbens]|uniref:Uncharacterized protein n=1 Tax=Urochloa decumbens TaxID=240449 RepID=A0ABC9A8M5_9POAL